MNKILTILLTINILQMQVYATNLSSLINENKKIKASKNNFLSSQVILPKKMYAYEYASKESKKLIKLKSKTSHVLLESKLIKNNEYPWFRIDKGWINSPYLHLVSNKKIKDEIEKKEIIDNKITKKEIIEDNSKYTIHIAYVIKERIEGFSNENLKDDNYVAIKYNKLYRILYGEYDTKEEAKKEIKNLSKKRQKYAKIIKISDFNKINKKLYITERKKANRNYASFSKKEKEKNINIRKYNNFIGLSFGYSQMNAEKNDITGSISLSRQIDEKTANISIEAGVKYQSYIYSLAYSKIKYNDIQLDNFLILASRTFDYKYFTPYIGLNLGMSFIELTKSHINSSIHTSRGKRTIYGLQVGLNKDISKDISFHTYVQYLKMNHKTALKAGLAESEILRNDNVNLNIGFRYNLY